MLLKLFKNFMQPTLPSENRQDVLARLEIANFKKEEEAKKKQRAFDEARKAYVENARPMCLKGFDVLIESLAGTAEKEIHRRTKKLEAGKFGDIRGDIMIVKVKNSFLRCPPFINDSPWSLRETGENGWFLSYDNIKLADYSQLYERGTLSPIFDKLSKFGDVSISIEGMCSLYNSVSRSNQLLLDPREWGFQGTLEQWKPADAVDYLSIEYMSVAVNMAKDFDPEKHRPGAVQKRISVPPLYVGFPYC